MFSSVVFPAPRKPVMMVMGRGAVVMVMLLHMSFDPHSHVMSHCYVIAIVEKNVSLRVYGIFSEEMNSLIDNT